MFLPKVLLKIDEKTSVSVNMTIYNVQKDSHNSKSYYIICLEDLRIEEEYIRKSFVHDITGLPNQLQSDKDLLALHAKVHMSKEKIAFVLLKLDNFEMLRAVIGSEQSTEILVKFAKHLEKLVLEQNVQIYHTYDDHFLLVFPFGYTWVGCQVVFISWYFSIK